MMMPSVLQEKRFILIKAIIRLKFLRSLLFKNDDSQEIPKTDKQI